MLPLLTIVALLLASGAVSGNETAKAVGRYKCMTKSGKVGLGTLYDAPASRWQMADGRRSIGFLAKVGGEQIALFKSRSAIRKRSGRLQRQCHQKLFQNTSPKSGRASSESP